MEKDYAQAVIAAAKKGMQPVDLVSRLATVLKAHGHMNLLPKIAHALRQEAKRERGGSELVLRVAKEADATNAKSAAAGYTKSAPVRIVEDSSLIGGWVLSTPDTRVDASYKKQLLNLYRKVTA